MAERAFVGVKTDRTRTILGVPFLVPVDWRFRWENESGVIIKDATEEEASYVDNEPVLLSLIQSKISSAGAKPVPAAIQAKPETDEAPAQESKRRRRRRK